MKLRQLTHENRNEVSESAVQVLGNGALRIVINTNDD